MLPQPQVPAVSPATDTCVGLGADAAVVLVSLQLDEEQVAPLALRDRERFDPGQIELVPLEDGHRVGQRAGPMLDLEHEGRLVFSGPLGGVLADDGETGEIALVVLDLLRQHGEAVVHARLDAGDGRRPLLLLR